MNAKPRSTCLIAEDDPDDREIFVMAMREANENCNCVFAKDGAEALEMLEKGVLVPDYIFIDQNMPRVNGIQCLTEIKKRSKLCHIPVIIYSTSSLQAHADDARDAGAMAFIVKPGSFIEFVTILSGLFAGRLLTGSLL